MKKKTGLAFGIFIILFLAYSAWNYFGKPDGSTVQIAKVQGLEGVCGIAADSNVLYLPNNMLREYCAILKDWIMKNI